MSQPVRDYAFYQAKRELADRRRRQDARDAERHRGFDLSAQDRHVKSERPHFAVVMASDAYRTGYERIFGGLHG